MTTHTTTPLKLERVEGGLFYRAADVDSYIVRCVKERKELLVALKKAVRHCWDTKGYATSPLQHELSAVIARAEKRT